MDSHHLKHLRTRLIEDFLAEQAKHRAAFDTSLAQLDKQIAEAEKVEMDGFKNPLVLVRGSLGARRRVYHSAEHPCKHTRHNGGKQQGFKRMTETEAKAMDGGVLKRCTNCWS
ncbi:hypothetical protein [Streptomyces mutabilis]|uniref:hypothetical protein n=1 Tax=Streptomyces mutabilis TaxID=67332 RepID=UPI0036B53579